MCETVRTLWDASVHLSLVIKVRIVVILLTVSLNVWGEA